jgi:G3E family GTPase
MINSGSAPPGRAMTTPRKGPIPPLPLVVITGFLGAGKTTLLNRLLRDPDMAGTLVIINEFGDVGLDHLLIESARDDHVLLQSGCLCCTIRGDLLATLEGLLRKRDNGRIEPFERVLIETTGLADPMPILQTVMSHPYLSLRYRLDGVITLIDAVNAAHTLDTQDEAVRQAGVADLLIVTKTDMAEAKEPEALEARLRALNPAAPIRKVANITARDMLACGLIDPLSKLPDVATWLRDEEILARMGTSAHRHSDGTIHTEPDPTSETARPGQSTQDRFRHSDAIAAHAFGSDKAMPPATYALFRQLLTSAHGNKLLRMKGLIRLSDNPTRPLVVHGVQHVFQDDQRLESWPDGDERTRIVVITRDLDPTFIEKLWQAFMGEKPLSPPA